MEKTKIKLMFWYIRIGRFIYGALFTLVLIITFVQIVERRSNFFIAIFIDVPLGIMGIILDSTSMRYRDRGTIYVETNKKEDRFDLVEFYTNKEKYFVSESMDEYVIKLPGEVYLKSYKKSEVILEENPNIDRPIIEIITTDKISKPAHNEYSIFALTGDKVKIENQKIIVKNKAKDIIKN